MLCPYWSACDYGTVEDVDSIGGWWYWTEEIDPLNTRGRIPGLHPKSMVGDPDMRDALQAKLLEMGYEITLKPRPNGQVLMELLGPIKLYRIIRSRESIWADAVILALGGQP